MHCMLYPPSLWLILPLVQICMNECQCVFCPEHFLLAAVQPCWHLLQIIAKYSWFNSCSGPTSEGDVYNKSRQDELITNTNQIVFAHIMDKPHSTLKKNCNGCFFQMQLLEVTVQEHIGCSVLFHFPSSSISLKYQRPRRTSKIEYYPLFYLEKWDTKHRRLAVSFYSSFVAPSKQRALSPDKFHFLPLIQR